MRTPATAANGDGRLRDSDQQLLPKTVTRAGPGFKELTMMAVTLPPPDDQAETYTTEEARSPSDPTASLLSSEIADLRWFWCQHESDLGIHSVVGSQLSAALAQRISDDALHDARVHKALLARLRRGWRPKAKRSKRRAPITEVALAHMDVDLNAGDGNFQRTRIDPERVDAGDLSGQTMYMRSPLRPTPPDPYENDAVLKHVARARRVRARLVPLPDTHVLVLHAAYGASSYGAARQALAKRYGELAEIVVALVAADGAPYAARALTIAKLHDDIFVRRHKNQAGWYLRAAAQAYAETRGTVPSATPPRGPRPVYGPGPVGHRALLGFTWER